MEKTRNIHLRNICDVDSRGVGNDGEFELIFTDYNENDIRKKLTLHLERYWIRFIADQLWQVISGEETEIGLIKEALNRDC